MVVWKLIREDERRVLCPDCRPDDGRGAEASKRVCGRWLADCHFESHFKFRAVGTRERSVKLRSTTGTTGENSKDQQNNRIDNLTTIGEQFYNIDSIAKRER